MRYNLAGEPIHPSDAQEAAYLRLRRRQGFKVGLYAATGATLLFVGVVLLIWDKWNPDWLLLLVVTALVLWAIGLGTHIWFAYLNSPITYDDADKAAMRFVERHGPPREWISAATAIAAAVGIEDRSRSKPLPPAQAG